MKPILIKNGTLITAMSSCKGDIAVSDGKITKTGTLDPKDFPDHQVIDAMGKLIFPGGIDPHVHLALPTPAGPSSDDFFSGSRAAIAGGTTSFIDFVTPGRGQSLTEALVLRKQEASSSLLDYSLHMGISEWTKQTPSEIHHIIEKEGISSFKTYLAYRESIGIDYSALKQVMEIVGPQGGIVLIHCEDGEMISRLQHEFIAAGKTGPQYHAESHPAEAEIRAVENVIELSARTNCPVYIVHTSTGKAKEAITEAKKSGLKIFAETCPQYLVLDDSVYFSDPDARKVLPFIISPPIRKKADQMELWKGLSDGTFDTVATDHCPFNLSGQKDRGINNFTKIPNGAGGIEHRLSLLYTYGVLTKRITLQEFVSLTSTRPAEIFGWGNRKGKLEAGFDADIVIWDPDHKDVISVNNHFQNCDSDIYEGLPIQGKPAIVMINGKIAFAHGMPRISGLNGHFLPTKK